MDLKTYLDNLKFTEQVIFFFVLIIIAGISLIFFGDERVATGMLILLTSLFISFIKTSAFCSLGMIKSCDSSQYVAADSIVTILIILISAYKFIFIFSSNLQCMSIFAAMWLTYLFWYKFLLKA